MADMMQLSEFLQKGRAKEVKELVQQAIDEGMSAKAILEGGLMHGMGIIGEKFKKNEIFVPEVLIAARAMNAGTELLKPLLIEDGVETKGTVVIGTVKGDLHDIGKNLVAMMMEGKGMKVVDLGSDVSAEKFVEAAQEQKANIIACSALLTTTMNQMKNVVKAVEDAGLRDSVKIMVGGAPVTESFCENIGADRYTADAATAAETAVELCQK
ncbi:corrinoid protein [Sediminispirochaeta smaragdinae]|jgi:corrinoid protein of di/trimethylamine methyltransferase|uniref:Methionine synthase n=1 Tax=Sediminispirochaeta smaragdinae (strain DSM 11293 / JCM 15392 / SEBR 4228) TaxID=573413 RepID=E1R8U4_SEDSS|nr:corrinoid protein [Sediminispirochaeta smaragdinae]ADK81851.1 Methionine synthase [Sediminispirochaeta smaragdinae DSM 11293]